MHHEAIFLKNGIRLLSHHMRINCQKLLLSPNISTMESLTTLIWLNLGKTLHIHNILIYPFNTIKDILFKILIRIETIFRRNKIKCIEIGITQLMYFLSKEIYHLNLLAAQMLVAPSLILILSQPEGKYKLLACS